MTEKGYPGTPDHHSPTLKIFLVGPPKYVQRNRLPLTVVTPVPVPVTGPVPLLRINLTPSTLLLPTFFLLGLVEVNRLS